MRAGGRAGAGGGDHCGRSVDAVEAGAGGGELGGEGTVAAAEIEDVLAGAGVEEIHDGRGEGCDETAVGGVGFGVPGLGGGRLVQGGLGHCESRFCGWFILERPSALTEKGPHGKGLRLAG